MEDHKHIPFKHGTITWTGDGYPSEEMMQVFNLMAEKAIELVDSQKDIDPDIAQVVNDNFWELL